MSTRCDFPNCTRESEHVTYPIEWVDLLAMSLPFIGTLWALLLRANYKTESLDLCNLHWKQIWAWRGPNRQEPKQ